MINSHLIFRHHRDTGYMRISYIHARRMLKVNINVVNFNEMLTKTQRRIYIYIIYYIFENIFMRLTTYYQTSYIQYSSPLQV